MREETNPVTGMETVAAAPGVEAGQGRPATMQYRPGLVALALLAALVPGVADATTRVSLSIAKSFHPGSARDYSTVHPGLGVTGPLAGEWLRWRAGVVRHSHSRWGPVTGLAATWGIAGNWRAGLERRHRRQLRPGTLVSPGRRARRAVGGRRTGPGVGVRSRAQREGHLLRRKRPDPDRAPVEKHRDRPGVSDRRVVKPWPESGCGGAVRLVAVLEQEPGGLRAFGLTRGELARAHLRPPPLRLSGSASASSNTRMASRLKSPQEARITSRISVP